MGTIVGVVIGYTLGRQAGDEGWGEYREAWKAIRSSQEVRDLLAGGLAVAGQLFGRGGQILSQMLARREDDSRFRRAA